MLHKKSLWHLTLFVAVIILGTIRPIQAQGTIDDIIITQVNTEEFPQIIVRFRALDLLHQPLTNLVLNDVQVAENGESIPPESLAPSEEGIWVHFVVDAGVWLTSDRWDHAHAAIQDFVQTKPWMKENVDHVALTVVLPSGEQTLVDFTSDGNSLLQPMAQFTPPGGTAYSNSVRAVGNIVDSMTILPEAANQPKFIVLFSAGLESGTNTISAVTQKAIEANIPIHTVLLRGGYGDPLFDLATETNGLTNDLLEEGYRSSDMEPIYTHILAYRHRYELSYRSTSGVQEPRLVEITIGASDTGTVADSAEYTIEVAPPRALIKSPTAGEIISRQAPEYTDDLSSIAPTTFTVSAEVIFPDNHLRRLRQATLLVNGVVADEITNPNVTGAIEFSWNLRDIQQQGISDFTLEIKIEDELGLTATSPVVNTKVDVSVPPAPDPEVLAAPTVDVEGLRDQITQEVENSLAIPPIQCIIPQEWICNNLERPVRRNLISVTSIAISFVFAGVVWVNRDKAPVRAVRDTIVQGVTRITNRYLGPSEAKAYLMVLDGDVNVGKTLEIFATTKVGRARQDSDLLFQQTVENSPISRLHCTILEEEDHFCIRDEDSANGTFLNGVKLKPLQAEELSDGDEIELARVERGGVRLMFRVANPEGVNNEDGTRVTKQTGSPNANNHQAKKSEDEWVN